MDQSDGPLSGAWSILGIVDELVAVRFVAPFCLLVGLGTGWTRGRARRVPSLAVSTLWFALIWRIDSEIER